MKKILAILTVIVLSIGGYFLASSLNDSREIEVMKQEQERMAQYFIERYPAVKKVEFQTFEENKKTGFYSSIAIINDKYRITFYTQGISGEISIDYYTKDFEHEIHRDSENYNNVEIIYGRNAD